MHRSSQGLLHYGPVRLQSLRDTTPLAELPEKHTGEPQTRVMLVEVSLETTGIGGWGVVWIERGNPTPGKPARQRGRAYHVLIVPEIVRDPGTVCQIRQFKPVGQHRRSGQCGT